MNCCKDKKNCCKDKTDHWKKNTCKKAPGKCDNAKYYAQAITADVKDGLSLGWERFNDTKAVKHFKTITEHKIKVGQNCFRCGLYKQGLLHDLSKYSWTEFSVGAKYFQGTRSPNEAEREEKGYTSSWLHHKGRNKHHLEYWVDYDLDKRDGSLTGMKMPDNYIVEMFCDRVAASKIYHKHDYTDQTPLGYYEHGKSKNLLHPYTRKRLEKLLHLLAEEGEDAAFAYARKYMDGYKRYKFRKFEKNMKLKAKVLRSKLSTEA